MSTLINAVKKNAELSVRIILEDADPNQKDEEGNTALHYAAERCNRSVVELLLSAKADPNLRGKWDWTALDFLQGRDKAIENILRKAMGLASLEEEEAEDEKKDSSAPKAAVPPLKLPNMAT
jgi:hypothetical protein